MKKANVNFIKELQNRFTSVDLVMLTTINLHGKPQSYPVVLVHVNRKGDIWCFSSDFAGSTNEISKHPLICLSHTNTVQMSFLSITGRAYLIDDFDTILKFWDPLLEQWFSQGLSTAYLSLIKISIEEYRKYEYSGKVLHHSNIRVA